MKKGFVFDLDGVITDTARYHYTAWKNLAAKININIDQEFNEQLKGISRMDSLEKILTYGGRENDFDPEEKKSLAESKNQEYFQSLQNLSAQDILPGAQIFLKEAKIRNVPCSLASASMNAPFIIKQLGVADCFDAIVDPRYLTKSKPDPEIYIMGAQIIGINPHHAIGFEDAQSGIESIKRAGMYAVGIVTSKPLKNADITVTRLDQLNIDDLLSI